MSLSLSLSLSKKSRKTIFINTGPTPERVLMLKADGALQQLEEETGEIYLADVFEKYIKPGKPFENMCLAVYTANIQLCKRKTGDEDNDNDDYEKAYKLR